MNKPPAPARQSPRPTKFESLIALALCALALMFFGATLDTIYRLVLAGWRAADFIFNLFFANP